MHSVCQLVGFLTRMTTRFLFISEKYLKKTFLL